MDVLLPVEHVGKCYAIIDGGELCLEASHIVGLLFLRTTGCRGGAEGRGKSLYASSSASVAALPLSMVHGEDKRCAHCHAGRLLLCAQERGDAPTYCVIIHCVVVQGANCHAWHDGRCKDESDVLGHAGPSL